MAFSSLSVFPYEKLLRVGQYYRALWFQHLGLVLFVVFFVSLCG